MNKDAIGMAIGWVFWAAGMVGTMVFAAGCSVQFGVDWHGQTGVDKRVQTELVRDGDTAVRPVKKGERY